MVGQAGKAIEVFYNRSGKRIGGGSFSHECEICKLDEKDFALMMRRKLWAIKTLYQDSGKDRVLEDHGAEEY